MELENKVVVITGAARGIGLGLAKACAAEGASAVVMLDLLESVMDAAAEVGDVATAHVSDVRDQEAFMSLLAEIESEHGRVDVMISNAGVAFAGGVESPDTEWQAIWEINLMAHVWAARQLVPGMEERGMGYLVNVASAAGLLTMVGAASYAVTKHAAVGLAEWLAITHGAKGVRVSCVCPMGVDTDMVSSFEASERLLRPDAISVEDLAAAVVEGMREERFMILPHPQVGDFLQRKVGDYDRWIGGMQRINRSVMAGVGEE